MSEGIAAKMCFNKKRYNGNIAAFAALGRMQSRFGYDQRAYRCPVCQGYHLTKQPKSESQLKAEEEAIKLFTR